MNEAAPPVLTRVLDPLPGWPGTPGVHALDHGAILRRHQPRGLRPGNAESMHGPVAVELQRSRGS